MYMAATTPKPPSAVSDAIRHSSLNFFRALDKSPDDMKITVRVGVAEPNKVDTDAVAAELPYGSVSVECVLGGPRSSRR